MRILNMFNIFGKVGDFASRHSRSKIFAQPILMPLSQIKEVKGYIRQILLPVYREFLVLTLTQKMKRSGNKTAIRFIPDNHLDTN